MPRFVEACEGRLGKWQVAVRWNREDPFQLLDPSEARERADSAEKLGELELAEALRSAASEADRNDRSMNDNC